MSERPRFVDQPENFVGPDGNVCHVGLRLVGGDGNYEWEPFTHEGKYDACRPCHGAPAGPYTEQETTK